MAHCDLFPLLLFALKRKSVVANSLQKFLVFLDASKCAKCTESWCCLMGCRSRVEDEVILCGRHKTSSLVCAPAPHYATMWVTGYFRAWKSLEAAGSFNSSHSGSVGLKRLFDRLDGLFRIRKHFLTVVVHHGSRHEHVALLFKAHVSGEANRALNQPLASLTSAHIMANSYLTFQDSEMHHKLSNATQHRPGSNMTLKHSPSSSHQPYTPLAS